MPSARSAREGDGFLVEHHGEGPRAEPLVPSEGESESLGAGRQIGIGGKAPGIRGILDTAGPYPPLDFGGGQACQRADGTAPRVHDVTQQHVVHVKDDEADGGGGRFFRDHGAVREARRSPRRNPSG